MATGESELRLRSVAELMQERFVVPSYQRGYRWTRTEVRALLNDLLEFTRLDTGRDAFYCLQPLVVRRCKDGVCEVVDGQQRLTTILLVLHSAKEMFPAAPYSIEFASRPGSGDALSAPDQISPDTNIDNFHICGAYRAIQEWFDEHAKNADYTAKMDVSRALQAKKDAGRSVQVIWYELGPDDHPIEMFTRLNRGKIPLTSAELIRAQLLNGKNFAVHRTDPTAAELPPAAAAFRPYEIAREWDAIELDLQGDRYWHFLQGDSEAPAARIELLFDLLVRLNRRTTVVQDPADLAAHHGVFFGYQEVVGRGRIEAGIEWSKAKEIAMRLREWYRDPRMYHLVGSLVWLASTSVEGKNYDRRAAATEVLVETLEAARTQPRTQVRRRLRERIWSRLFPDKAFPDGARQVVSDALLTRLESDDYTYGDMTTNTRIRAVLLLFNIATHMQVAQTSRYFFPFDAFRHESWDIEHIRATEDTYPNRDYLQVQWLEQMIEYFKAGNDGTESAGAGDLADAQRLVDIGRTKLEQEFPAFYRRILDRYERTGQTDDANGEGAGNSLSNLALLRAGTNRSIGNQMFRMKRKEILQRERQGEFVPVCTRNVFLKYYTPEVKNTLYWNATDRAAYLVEMASTLAAFFQEDVG